jgi:hypothetical protein
MTETSCPRCGSDDVRLSHRSFGLDRIGLHRCRCRACRVHFWLLGRQLQAVVTRRRQDLEAPAEPAVPARPLKDQFAAARPVDLDALDQELARKRSETPPR